MSLNSLEVCCSTFPQYSHLTWLHSRPSLSGQTELSSASELRLGQRSTHRTPFHPLWPRRHSHSHWSISGAAIHHFVLLKVFECPAQWCGAASAILLHRWKCLTLRLQTWGSSFLPLQTIMAVSKSRSEMCGLRVFFLAHCKDGLLKWGSIVLHKVKTKF